MFVLALLTSVFLTMSSSPRCRGITDDDRRGFTDSDLQPIVLDLDGDGKADKITPRLVVKKYRDRRSSLHQSEWIFFDLKTSRGRSIRSFFGYRYGTDKVDYWVWASVPCRSNQKGAGDLVFYSGDDTSDETIVLLNRGNHFIADSRKISSAQ
jgi:hypothetical protein